MASIGHVHSGKSEIANEKMVYNSDDEKDDIYPEINNIIFDKGEVQPYFFLVVSALYHLYYDNENDRRFMKKFLSEFAEDKKINKTEKDRLEGMMLKGEFGLEPISMHVGAVKKTSIYRKYGTGIFIYNLILNSIKNGVYDARAKTLIKYIAYQLIYDGDDNDAGERKKSGKGMKDLVDINGALEDIINQRGGFDDHLNNGADDDDDDGAVSDDGDSGCHDDDIVAANALQIEEKSDKGIDSIDNYDDEYEDKADVISETIIGDGDEDEDGGGDEDEDDGGGGDITEVLPHYDDDGDDDCTCDDRNKDADAVCSDENKNNENIIERVDDAEKENQDNDDKKKNKDNDVDGDGDDDDVVDEEKRKVDRCACLSRDLVELMEDKLQVRFLNMAYEQSKKEKDEKTKKDSQRKLKKIALIGLVSIGGGVLIGLTAGLAAPLVAGGLGLATGAVGTMLFATKAGLAVVGSLFGLAGAGLTGHKMNKRVGDLEEFEFEELSEGRSLTITLAITGWLNEKYTGFRKVWLGLGNSAEQYVLVYESKHMRELGDSLKRITDIGVSLAVTQSLGYTALSGLLQAMMWPMALLNVAEVIDNPWNVCTKRSSLAGEHLADVLLAREQGNRPVTLVGFGVGARVVFSCLQEMATRENCEGIVEEAILLGAPVTADAEQWKKLQKVVSGRIVNGYSSSDWLMRFIFRTASAQLRVAGLQPIDWNHRIMQNLNLNDVVSGHFDYMEKIDNILALAGVKTKKRVPVQNMSSLAHWTSLKQQQLTMNKKDVKKNLKPALV